MSAGMEAAIANMLEPGEAIVVGNNGIWGQRVADLAQRYGGEHPDACLSTLYCHVPQCYCTKASTNNFEVGRECHQYGEGSRGHSVPERNSGRSGTAQACCSVPVSGEIMQLDCEG